MKYHFEKHSTRSISNSLDTPISNNVAILSNFKDDISSWSLEITPHHVINSDNNKNNSTGNSSNINDNSTIQFVIIVRIGETCDFRNTTRQTTIRRCLQYPNDTAASTMDRKEKNSWPGSGDFRARSRLGCDFIFLFFISCFNFSFRT